MSKRKSPDLTVPNQVIVWRFCLIISSRIEGRFAFPVALDRAILDQLLEGILNRFLTDGGNQFHNLALQTDIPSHHISAAIQQ